MHRARILGSLLAATIALVADAGRSAAQESRPVASPVVTAESYLRRAGEKYKAKQYDAAIADASEAIRLEPGMAEAYYYRGAARGSKGETDAAIPDLDRAIQLDPRLVKAYGARGRAYGARGEFERAIAEATTAIQLDPKHSRG